MNILRFLGDNPATEITIWANDWNLCIIIDMNHEHNIINIVILFSPVY